MLYLAPLPPPSGGVTSFAKRFGSYYQKTKDQDFVCVNRNIFAALLVAWLYPSKSRVIVISLSTHSFGGFLFVLSVLLFFWWANKVYYIHHHGSFLNTLGARLFRLLFKVWKGKLFVLALNADLLKEFQSIYGYDSAIQMSGYYPPILYESFISEPRGNKRLTSVVFSGYPTEIYRHAWMLNFLNKYDSILASKNVIFNIFLYGTPLDLKNSLAFKYSSFESVNLFQDRNEEEFLPYLSNADIYARLTSLDSTGLALYDALLCNVPIIIATKLNSRPSLRASDYLINHSYADFEGALISSLEDLGHRIPSGISSSKMKRQAVGCDGSHLDFRSQVMETLNFNDSLFFE